MPVGSAGIGAAGAIGGALLQSNSANNAIDAQTQANELAIQEQQREYNTSRSDLMPWLTTGHSALNQLADIYGLNTERNGQFVHGQPGQGPDYSSFYKSPDYQFALKQGIGGVDAGAAATGSLDSGATRKAEMRYSSGLASANFNDYANRLSGLAGVGQTTASNLGSLGQSNANSISQIYQNQGDALASGYLAQGNIYSRALGQLGGYGASAYASLPGAPNSDFNANFSTALNSVPYIG